MSKLVEELKKDHVLMVDMLNKVKELGITKKRKVRIYSYRQRPIYLHI